MPHQYENALAICLSTYSLLLEQLGIADQQKEFEQILEKLSDRKVGIEQDLFIQDAFINLKIKVTNDGKFNFVKVELPGTEFDSLKIPDGFETNAKEFKNEVKPILEPILNYVRQLINR